MMNSDLLFEDEDEDEEENLCHECFVPCEGRYCRACLKAMAGDMRRDHEKDEGKWKR
jgi:hypothetical protein